MSDAPSPRMTDTSSVLRGFMYTHNRANSNTAELHNTGAGLQAAIELLIERGLIDRDEWEARRQITAERLRKEYLARGMAVAVQEFGVSKYEFKGGAEIDCGNRLHLCQAACCRLPFALSQEDVEEGLVSWDLGQPYINARGADGSCQHLQRESCGCGVYEHRPIPCRGYDCREDKRIWLDFGERVINPEITNPNWPECLETTEPAG